MLKGATHQKIRSVAIWFYIIAGFEMLTAYMLYNRLAESPALAQAAMVFASIDVTLGLSFVVLGYFASKKHPWAFVVGLFLYAIRAILQFFQFFSIISLVIRAFLLFRIYQGLQACLDAQRADTLAKLQRISKTTVEPALAAPSAPAAAAWSPARPVSSASQSQSRN